MRRRQVISALAAVAAVAAAAGLPLSTASARQGQQAGGAEQLYVYEVPAPTSADADRLTRAGFDVLENRVGDDLFVLGTKKTADKLRAAGFSSTVSQTLRPIVGKAPSTRLVANAPGPSVAPVDETYYGGYHTVRAQFAHLDKIAKDHPGLAKVVDYGDSYLKTRNPATGYDLKAICLTKKKAGDCALNPSVKKPRFLFMTQIHAREIVTSDVAWRFIDHLAKDYGKDAEVTGLLNTTEVWVVPVVNPDGVDLVQQGGNHPYLQRKNLHGTGCSTSGGGQNGVDLNRNTPNHWNTTGTEPDKCSEVFPGRTAGSEPETKAIDKLFTELFKDQRGTGDTTPAPASTRGAMISMHSFAAMDLLPWGWTNKHTGNDKGLRSIAARMSKFNGYEYGQPGEILYNASGTSDDWTYGRLGIASFTIEAASCGDFTPRHSCTATDYKKNLPALMYVAKSAAAPYKSSLGPVSTVTGVQAATAGAATVSVTVDDAAFGTAGKRAAKPVADRVAAAEYTVDGGTGPHAMKLTGSGSTVKATASLRGLTPGRHLVYVRGRDTAGNWGVPTATWVTVS